MKSLEAENKRLREQQRQSSGIEAAPARGRSSQNLQFRERLDQATTGGKSWKEAYDKMRDQRESRFKETLQRISVKPIYMSRHGACRHASRLCVKEKTANEVYARQPCKQCAHTFLEDQVPSVPASTHRSTRSGDVAASSSSADF